MTHQWNIDDRPVPGKTSAWTIALIVLALFAGLGGSWFRWRLQVDPIERYYWGTYVATTYQAWNDSGPFHRPSLHTYQIICWVDAQSGRVIDAAVPANTEFSIADNGNLQGTKIGQTPRGQYRFQVVPWHLTAQQMRDWLGSRIYDDEPAIELVKWYFEGAGILAVAVFVCGIYFAFDADRRRARLRKEGQYRRGARVTTTGEFNSEAK